MEHFTDEYFCSVSYFESVRFPGNCILCLCWSQSFTFAYWMTENFCLWHSCLFSKSMCVAWFPNQISAFSCYFLSSWHPLKCFPLVFMMLLPAILSSLLRKDRKAPSLLVWYSSGLCHRLAFSCLCSTNFPWGTSLLWCNRIFSPKNSTLESFPTHAFQCWFSCMVCADVKVGSQSHLPACLTCSDTSAGDGLVSSQLIPGVGSYLTVWGLPRPHELSC